MDDSDDLIDLDLKWSKPPPEPPPEYSSHALNLSLYIVAICAGGWSGEAIVIPPGSVGGLLTYLVAFGPAAIVLSAARWTIVQLLLSVAVVASGVVVIALLMAVDDSSTAGLLLVITFPFSLGLSALVAIFARRANPVVR